jgi:hypothetical protein
MSVYFMGKTRLEPGIFAPENANKPLASRPRFDLSPVAIYYPDNIKGDRHPHMPRLAFGAFLERHGVPILQAAEVLPTLSFVLT